MVNKNIGVIIQARTSSSRFRNKILSKIKNKTILEILLLRLKKSKKINQFIVAIPHEDRNSEIVKISKKCGYHIVTGSKHNLVARYHKAAKKFNIQNIIRITSDCPLIDKKLIDKAISIFKKKNLTSCQIVIHLLIQMALTLKYLNLNCYQKYIKLS